MQKARGYGELLAIGILTLVGLAGCSPPSESLPVPKDATAPAGGAETGGDVSPAGSPAKQTPEAEATEDATTQAALETQADTQSTARDIPAHEIKIFKGMVPHQALPGEPLSPQTRTFVRSGDFLGCADPPACQTLVIATSDHCELIESTTGHLKRSFVWPGAETPIQLELLNDKVMMLDYDFVIHVIDLSSGTELTTLEAQVPETWSTFEIQFRVSSQFVALNHPNDNSNTSVLVYSLQVPSQKPLTLIHTRSLREWVINDHFVVAHDDNDSLLVWELPSGKLKTIEYGMGPITALSLQGARVALATYDPVFAVSTLQVFDLEQEKVIHRHKLKSPDHIRSLTWEGEKIIFSGIYDLGLISRLGQWDLDLGSVTTFVLDTQLRSIQRMVPSVAHWIVVLDWGGWESPIFFLNRSGQLERTLSFDKKTSVTALALQGNTLLAGASPHLNFWDISSGQPIPGRGVELPTWHGGLYLSSIVGTRLVAASKFVSQEMYILDWSKGELIQSIDAKNTINQWGLGGSRFVFYVPETGSLPVWDIETGSQVGMLSGVDAANEIYRLRAHDGYAVAMDEDARVYVWDLQTLQLVSTLAPFSEELGEYAWPQDVYVFNDDVVYVLWDELRIRNWRTGEVIQQIMLSGDSDPTHVLGYQPGLFFRDPLLILCGPERSLRIWDIRVGKYLKNFLINSTLCVLDQSVTERVRFAGTNGRSVEVFEFDPKTLEGRALASERSSFRHLRTIEMVPESQTLTVTVTDHRPWFRRLWDALKQWFVSVFD